MFFVSCCHCVYFQSPTISKCWNIEDEGISCTIWLVLSEFNCNNNNVVIIVVCRSPLADFVFIYTVGWGHYIYIYSECRSLTRTRWFPPPFLPFRHWYEQNYLDLNSHANLVVMCLEIARTNNNSINNTVTLHRYLHGFSKPVRFKKNPIQNGNWIFVAFYNKDSHAKKKEEFRSQ